MRATNSNCRDIVMVQGNSSCMATEGRGCSVGICSARNTHSSLQAPPHTHTQHPTDTPKHSFGGRIRRFIAGLAVMAARIQLDDYAL